MLRPTNAIIRDNVGNIIHRGFVVTGEVAVDNGNGSYDVYIAGEAKAYPKIFTLARNPDLAVGDIVRILYKNGCKELPIILPPTTAAVSEFIFVVYQTGGSYYLNRYTYDGVLNAELGVLSEITGSITKVIVDSNYNLYIVSYNYPNRIIYKYDKDGTYISTTNMVSSETYFAISPNGYIYSLDTARGYRNYIRERNLSDLSLNNTYTLSGERYYYLTFDSDGYAYLYDWDTTSSLLWGYVKYKLGVGTISKHLQGNAASSIDSWVIAGDYIGCNGSQIIPALMPYTIAKNMTADRVVWILDDITSIYKMASTLDNFICLGIDAGGKLIMEKYTPERIREWKVEVATVFTADKSYCGIGAYPF